MKEVKLYDTTLRDGTQGEGVSFSVEDKLRITRKLDEFGIHYVEGGWPGSNPRDIKFFKRAKELKLKHAKVAAFGSTHRAKLDVSKDELIHALLEAETEVVTIFGKTWDLHVREALEIPLERNLEIIRDTLSYLKRYVPEAFYDAEHFFDGYKNNPEYALKTLQAAQEGQADWIILCDTNGGLLPFEMAPILEEVKKVIKIPLGIHVHNDSETAVANSLIAVSLGITQVQGTINGYGERCGNANLCSIIPNLQLKMGYRCVPPEKLAHLREVSRFISELANMKHARNQPFVGESAFAHKGGVHVSAVMKNPDTYEHIKPEQVGNHRRVLVSDLSGRSNVLFKAAEYNVDLEKVTPAAKEILEKLKKLEEEGFEFEAAEASFDLLMKKIMGTNEKFFDLEGFRVIVEKKGEEPTYSEATIKIRVKDIVEHTASEGNGPVNALDNALRKALEEFYPHLKNMELVDYKVRILDEREGTGSTTRVLIQSADEKDVWGTVGVSENIIEASWQALTDSILFKLHKDQGKK